MLLDMFIILELYHIYIEMSILFFVFSIIGNDKTTFVLLVPCAEFVPLKRHFSASNSCGSPLRSGRF